MSDHNSEKSPNVLCDSPLEKSDDSDQYEGDYAESTRLPFPELLKFHHKQTVWGFQFGKEVRENMKTIQDKQTEENNEVNQEKQSAVDTDIAGSSKDIIERDQKTPHSRRRTGTKRSSKRKNSTKNSDFVSPQKSRRAPLPLMDWADSKEVS